MTTGNSAVVFSSWSSRMHSMAYAWAVCARIRQWSWSTGKFIFFNSDTTKGRRHGAEFASCCQTKRELNEENPPWNISVITGVPCEIKTEKLDKWRRMLIKKRWKNRKYFCWKFQGSSKTIQFSQLVQVILFLFNIFKSVI